MNHKTLLSTLALATLVAGTAKANEDITSPFYLPSDLETLSETSVKYERTNIDDGGAKEDFILRETALVGFGIENAVILIPVLKCELLNKLKNKSLIVIFPCIY